jgi:hypothetical protein
MSISLSLFVPLPRARILIPILHRLLLLRDPLHRITHKRRTFHLKVRLLNLLFLPLEMVALLLGVEMVVKGISMEDCR